MYYNYVYDACTILIGTYIAVLYTLVHSMSRCLLYNTYIAVLYTGTYYYSLVYSISMRCVTSAHNILERVIEHVT